MLPINLRSFWFILVTLFETMKVCFYQNKYFFSVSLFFWDLKWEMKQHLIISNRCFFQTVSVVTRPKLILYETFMWWLQRRMNVFCTFSLSCVSIWDQIEIIMAVLVLSSAGNLMAVLENIFDHCRGVFMALQNTNSAFFVKIVIGSCPLTILAEKLNHTYFTWP